MRSKRLAKYALLRAFQHRAFVLLWSGQLLSRLGDFLYQIALAWWVLESTGSATAMATVLIIPFGPASTRIAMDGGPETIDRLPSTVYGLFTRGFGQSPIV